jgi:DNA-binding GntR family transcriptional regulator
MNEHAEILAALEARDGAELSTILRRHLAGKLAALTEALQEPR